MPTSNHRARQHVTKIFLLAISLCFGAHLSGQTEYLGRDEVWHEYNLGLVGQTTRHPSHGPIKAGVQAAIDEMEKAHKLGITLLDETPRPISGDAQVAAIKKLYPKQLHGLIINPEPAELLKTSFDFLTRQQIPIISYGRTFEDHSMLASVVGDDHQAGYDATLACLKALGHSRQTIAILAGNPANPQSAARLAGAEAALAEKGHEDYVIHNHLETVSAAFKKLKQTQEADRNDTLGGWVFLGNWALQSTTPLPWDSKWPPACVAIDALPRMVTYMATEQVDEMLAQDYYQWGYLAAKTLIEKIHLKADPHNKLLTVPASSVSQKTLKPFRQQWAVWLK